MSLGRRAVVGPMAALVAILVGATPVLAGGWSQPDLMEGDPDAPAVDRPALAFHDGGFHVAVATRGEEPGIRLHTIQGGGSTFDRVTTKRDRQPSLAISDEGVFHLAFSRRGTGCSEAPCTVGIFYARSTNGDDWTIQRVHRGAHDVHPSLALDPAGKPWIYYRSRNRIVEAHKSQGEWSNAPIASGCCGPDPLAGPEATVAGGQGQSAGGAAIDSLSPFTRLAVFRENFDGGQIVFSIFELDFVESFVVSRADDAFDPDLVLDDAQDLHIAYRRAGDGLWYAEPGENRFERTKIASVEIQGAPAIAALPGGDVLVVAPTQNGLIYRTRLSGTWSGGPIDLTGSLRGSPGLATKPSGAARVAFHCDATPGGFCVTSHAASW